MGLKITKEVLRGVKFLSPELITDDRGTFCETYKKDEFREIGINEEFVQENQSSSKIGVIRGLHFQFNPPLGKLVRVLNGLAYLVFVDIRKESSSLGKWHGENLSEEYRGQVWVPAGFACGFCALENNTEVLYKYNAFYNREGESNIRWDDPEIGIDWPNRYAILSDRDKNAQTLAEWLVTEESNYFR